MRWLRGLTRSARWDGTSGRPRSANGASSFHLFWEAPEGAWTGAEAVLEVVRAPVVRALYFWALQVSFVDRGRAGGGAHLGLQWHPAHPGSTAVNWGGYDDNGRELTGSASELPSETANPNTRDYAWRPGRAYRLRVDRGAQAPGGLTAWTGSVVDLASGERTVVRDLFARGTHVGSPMVWSEVFADCDAPGVEVRWRDLRLVDAQGTHAVEAVVVNYQRVQDGGCVTTDSEVRGDDLVQRTGVRRLRRQGERLVLGERSVG